MKPPCGTGDPFSKPVHDFCILISHFSDSSGGLNGSDVFWILDRCTNY